MPQNQKVITRISDGKWCKVAGDSVHASVFTDNPEEVLLFLNLDAADFQIASWGETPGTNFIGQNPPPR